jgi:hypothetical protein
MEFAVLWKLTEGAIVGNDRGEVAWWPISETTDVFNTPDSPRVLPTTCNTVIFDGDDGTPLDEVHVREHVVYTRESRYAVRCGYAPKTRTWVIRGEPKKVFTMRDWVEGKDVDIDKS